jgi:hypothetical protein
MLHLRLIGLLKVFFLHACRESVVITRLHHGTPRVIPACIVLLRSR